MFSTGATITENIRNAESCEAYLQVHVAIPYLLAIYEINEYVYVSDLRFRSRSFFQDARVHELEDCKSTI